MNDDFIEVDFCRECIRYDECNNSKFDINILEKYMIYTTLKENESNMDEQIKLLLKNSNYLYLEVIEFMENKKQDCVFFDNN